MKHILKSSELFNLMINIFKVVEGEGDINKKDYKNKHFFSKIVKTVLFWKISLLTLPKT